MTNPQGITGIVGFVDAAPEADAIERQGGFADPKHGIEGEQATPYPWEEFPGESHGPYGLENELLGMDIASFVEPAGNLGQDPTADLQPNTRAANWPKGLPQSTFPDDQEAWREQESEIHAQNMGGSREALYEPTLNPVQDEWTELLETDPGITFPAMVPLPGQLQAGGSGGWGSRDRVQSLARQNEYGYDAAHMHRRYATGAIPGNYMWMEPGSRPMIKTVPGTARVPVGVDSPFAGQDPGASYDAQGAALLNLPTAYQSPPEPALAPSYSSVEAPSVDLW